MLSTLETMKPFLVLSAPIIMWLIGLTSSKAANAKPKLMAHLNSAGIWLAFGCAVLAGIAHLGGEVITVTLFSFELPGNIGNFSLSTYINGSTVIMLTLVSFVGVVVSRYSYNYLDGDPNQGRFHKWLCLTLASILTLIVSGNLMMFLLAWISMSLCLHQLLMFYSDRPGALVASHKKFIASRIGDLSLLIAVLLIGSSLHTLELNEIFTIVANAEQPLPGGVAAAAWFIVISAALKSAQFPFHGWIIQVMEAPTPVSALLHAGIVNAGAFLIIRMSPIMAQSNMALDVLAVIGLVTLGLASLSMLTQTSIKVSLAWSTIAQMGFMLLECGLGLYSLAMLHLVAHSLYKAHAFLASGSGVDYFRAPAIKFEGAKISAKHWFGALALSAVISVIVGVLFGIDISHEPALIATGVIVAIAMSQLIIQSASIMETRYFLVVAIVKTTAVCVAYYALHIVFEHAIADSVILPSKTEGSAQVVIIALIIAYFLALLMLQHAFRTSKAKWRENFYVHLYNGLYIDVLISRISNKIWPAPSPEEDTSGAKS